MNKILVFFAIVLSISNLAMAASKACALKDSKAREIEIISTNIANSETTRTPEGGPYKRKTLVCKSKLDCKVEESKEVNLRYSPDHYDAQANGYVAFPAIDVKLEMENLNSAETAYDKLRIACLNQK